jgi:hypothetical protein
MQLAAVMPVNIARITPCEARGSKVIAASPITK